MENRDRTAEVQQEARSIYPNYIHWKITSYWCFGLQAWKVPTDKHKAAVHKYNHFIIMPPL